MKNKIGLLIGLFVFSLALTYLYREKIMRLFFTPRETEVVPGVTLKSTPDAVKDIEMIAENLVIPWEIVFLPNGDMLVTERPGKLLKVGSTTKVIKEIEGVKHIGEGGLLGMAIHPQFSSNNFIYLYLTTQEGGAITNRVERYKFLNDTLNDKKIILEGIKGSSNHDGGRMAFGPDGYLYITTGDAETPAFSQDKNSLNGKILRIRDDGSIPPDNPFDNAVYSFGHRNPQGLSWDKNGNFWSSEHGPSGSQTGHDEVNLIVKGGNYGWPDIRGDQTKDGMISPVINSGRSDTWAPSGMAYSESSLFFSGLRGEALYQAKITGDNKLDLSEHFKKEYGRIRAVVVGPDGFLYISTSNRDGRGKVKTGDDKIIKINPQIFK